MLATYSSQKDSITLELCGRKFPLEWGSPHAEGGVKGEEEWDWGLSAIRKSTSPLHIQSIECAGLIHVCIT